MIKNIVFDIGNVILEGSPKFALKYIEIDEESKNIIENIVFNNPSWDDLDLGKDDFDSYFKKIKQELPSELQDIGEDALKKSFQYRKMNNNIVKLIQKLSDNYKIYILSDNNIDTILYLKETDLNKFISSWCVSSEYGEIKENKKLFEIFFKVNSLNPNECYFIDDKICNIKIANSFGMNGFELNWKDKGFDELLIDMQNNGIQI